jgi:hypothetical protein
MAAGHAACGLGQVLGSRLPPFQGRSSRAGGRIARLDGRTGVSGYRLGPRLRGSNCFAPSLPGR